MQPASTYDWTPGVKEIQDISKCAGECEWMEELYPSPDGEQVARVVKIANEEEAEFGVQVNGQLWESTFEKIWNLRYSPDGRLSALVSEMAEWSLAVDGQAWEENYAFVWGTKFSKSGDVIAACVQADGEYGMLKEGVIWENLYENANNFVLSLSGKDTAAVVQTRNIPQADIDTYQEGCFTVAVNGQPWDKNFVNCWTPVFSPDESKIACQVRHNLLDYTIAVNGESWPVTFNCVWDPAFNPVDGSIVAPVRVGGKWGMAKDGEIIWPAKFVNCWHQQYSADGKNLYAIVAPKYGRWTVAKNGQAWGETFGQMATDLVVSPDGKHAAIVGQDKGQWGIIADDTRWVGWYDMAYTPVYSPDSKYCAVRVERAGKRFTVVLNGHVFHEEFDQLWDPVFSPEGTMIMLRAVKDGKYIRLVVPVSDF